MLWRRRVDRLRSSNHKRRCEGCSPPLLLVVSGAGGRNLTTQTDGIVLPRQSWCIGGRFPAGPIAGSVPRGRARAGRVAAEWLYESCKGTARLLPLRRRLCKGRRWRDRGSCRRSRIGRIGRGSSRPSLVGVGHGGRGCKDRLPEMDGGVVLLVSQVVPRPAVHGQRNNWIECNVSMTCSKKKTPRRAKSISVESRSRTWKGATVVVQGMVEKSSSASLQSVYGSTICLLGRLEMDGWLSVCCFEVWLYACCMLAVC
jgi:hypothetical protein